MLEKAALLALSLTFIGSAQESNAAQPAFDNTNTLRIMTTDNCKKTNQPVETVIVREAVIPQTIVLQTKGLKLKPQRI